MSNRIFTNAKWIIGCKIVQSLMQLVIGMLSARYLGPANFGLINYAASIAAIVTPIMTLGFPNTLVQEYVGNPNHEGEILGTHLLMNLLSAMACMVGVVSFAAVANPGEQITILVCALYSVSLFSQALEMIQYWFQAKLLSKYSSLAMLCAYIVLSAYKIWLLVSGKSVYWFALSHAVEYGVAGLLMLIAYKKLGTQKMQVSLALARKLINKSRYYIVSSMMVMLFGRIAGIILVQICGEIENGFYAAAVTCTSITGFVFSAIIDTSRPVVLESRKKSIEVFEQNVSRVYSMIIWLSLLQSVFFTVFAWLIVSVLYGENYLPAIPVLQILVWSTAFSYMGVVRNIWILGEEKHNILWLINLSGAIASILLNFLLIPAWGACGAAVASVLTQIFTNMVMGFILKPVRPNNRLLLRGMDPRLLLEIGTMLLRK